MSDRCGKCKHFGIHGEPHLIQFASGIKFGWTHRCEFDKKLTDPDGEPCVKYLNRMDENNKYWIDKMAVADKYAAMDNQAMQQTDLF